MLFINLTRSFFIRFSRNKEKKHGKISKKRREGYTGERKRKEIEFHKNKKIKVKSKKVINKNEAREKILKLFQEAKA